MFWQGRSFVPEVVTMSLMAAIESFSRGAEFRRADLHIHSFGSRGSYDVKDATMTPDQIVETAIAEGLEVISITDHNCIGNVEAALEHAKGRPILVIPGVELSTPNGHLLLYFPTYRDLDNFFGAVSFTNDRRACNHTMKQCLDMACNHDGIGIAAHIDLDSGFESMMSRYDTFKEDLLKCRNLLALEISKVESETWFTDRDDNPNRKRIHGLRRTEHGEEETYELPKVMNSDAHTLGALGRNARGARKLTRLKMESLTFDAFRIALVDASARVRIEDMIPAEVPRFVGMKLEGGILDGQVVHFSGNLTCIIGGRGAGKSTLLESLRAASGNPARTSLIDSEVWPNRIALVYQDEAGRQQVLARTKLNEVMNLSDPEDGPTMIPIESYGQGETAETIQHCDKDPGILLDFLDGFLDVAAYRRRDEELRRQLLDNQTTIERLQLDVATIPDVQRAKNNAEAQLKALKEKDASRIVQLEEKLAKGRAFRSQLTEHLKNLLGSAREALADTSMTDLVIGMDGSSLVVGQEEFAALRKVVEEFADKIKDYADRINADTTQVVSTIKEHLGRWTAQETQVQEEIEEIRRDLAAKGVRLDIAFIRKVTKDVSDFDANLKVLQTKRAQLATASTQRRDILKERRANKAKVFSMRSAFAASLNQNLRATVSDFAITIKYHEGTYSPEFEELLKTVLGWRTTQVPRARLIASQLSPLKLAEAVGSNNPSPLQEIRDADGNQAFRTEEARKIIQALSQPRARFDLERCPFEDCPELKVTKEVPQPDGKSRYISRDFSKLSLGQ